MKTLADERSRAELHERLTTVRPDSAARWGRMSSHQMVCHLADACRMALGEKVVSPASGLRQRTLVKWIALYAPMRWPPGLPTRPEIDQHSCGMRPADFAEDVRTVAALLDRIAARPREGVWPPHPIFGRMSPAAWLRWAYLHTDHHLRQFGA
jgi:Protein of unknown function (DUF1569)